MEMQYDRAKNTLWEFMGTVFSEEKGFYVPLYTPIILEGVPQFTGSKMTILSNFEDLEDYSRKSLKELLKEFAGLEEEDFSNHESDLYVRWKGSTDNTDIKKYIMAFSTKVLQIDRINSSTAHIGAKGTPWAGDYFYDIPFGYMQEHSKARGIK